MNGYFNQPKEQPGLNEHGFNYWMATHNNAVPSHLDPENFVRNGKKVGKIKGYSADIVADEAVKWLSEIRDPKKPFFLNIWAHEPHTPIESDPKHQTHYQDLDENHRQHHANVTQLDASFGKVMRALNELNLTNDTFVIFTSDNGPEGRQYKWGWGPERSRGSTGGLRGRKRDDFEGGIRVPGIVRWPGQVEAGQVSSVPVVGSDIFSTILSIAGIPLPYGPCDRWSRHASSTCRATFE